MSTDQSAVMLCGWGVKAGWLIPYVDKRVGGRYNCVIPCLTRANLSALEMSVAHIIKRYANVLFILYLTTLRPNCITLSW